MTTNPNEIEASLERWPGYTEQSWSERFAELDKRFGQLNASISTALLNRPAASARGVADGWREIESAPKDEAILIWTGLFGGNAVIVRWDDDRYAKSPIPRWVTRDPIYGRRAFVDKPPAHWMPLPADPSSPATTPEVERDWRKPFEESYRVIRQAVKDLERREKIDGHLPPNVFAVYGQAISALMPAMAELDTLRKEAALRTPPAPAGEKLAKLIAKMIHDILENDDDSEGGGYLRAARAVIAIRDSTGFIAGLDAAAGVAEAHRAPKPITPSDYDEACSDIATAIRAIEPPVEGGK